MSTYANMKNPAVYLHAAFDAKIQESPYPTITDPHDVIIKIAYVGVCGSDVHFWTHGHIGDAHVTQPQVVGHEASGTIHEVGSSVSLKIGTRVAIEPGFPCRRCLPCKSGHYNLCPKMAFAACVASPTTPSTPGTLARYFKIPSDFIYPLPPSLSLQEGVLVEPLAVAVHICRLAHISLGKSVVIFGAGTIGLLCSAVAKAMGALKIINVDTNSSRLEFASSYASSGTFNPGSSSTPAETARSLIETFELGEGADIVLEATGAASCIIAGIHVLKRGGQFIQAGLGQSHISDFPITLLSEKEIHFHGSFRYKAGEYEIAMGLLESGKVGVGELITGVVGFEGATEAWEGMRRGEGRKTLIEGPRDG